MDMLLSAWVAESWILHSSGPESHGASDTDALGLTQEAGLSSCFGPESHSPGFRSFGPVRGASILCSWCAPTRGFRLGAPPGFQVWVPSPLILVRATGLQVSTGAAYPEFTV